MLRIGSVSVAWSEVRIVSQIRFKKIKTHKNTSRLGSESSADEQLNDPQSADGVLCTQARIPCLLIQLILET